jgi:hypothetical protein
MKTLLTLAAAGLLLASCAPMTNDPMPVPGGTDENLTQCKADRYQQYIGRQRSELPPKPADANWRVACSTCPMTMDFHEDRMNVVYDQNTNVITRIFCG